MDDVLKTKILRLLGAHRTMTLATVRPDGWPQATTVGYVNQGLDIFFLCGADSQKTGNLAHDDRVSLTIDQDCDDIMTIEGLSMAARARPVTDRKEVLRILTMLVNRYPSQPSFRGPLPEPETTRVFRLVPEVISVLDYSKGFGHTDLVVLGPADEPVLVRETGAPA
jgi:nitroimidazol reductase NimA-like FMN-containing flavoprotein (pyridoxamine 5'-phosphate oxidase superfamily)